jgi:DNA-directed RNA polymerase subunit omega
MYQELLQEVIVNKVGGRFKLSALMQKRLVALNRGARPLVDLVTNDPMEVVIAEIMQDKIYLDASGNLAVGDSKSTSKAMTEPTDGGPTLGDAG